jgi:uncharacterized protein (TIGR03435 family)
MMRCFVACLLMSVAVIAQSPPPFDAAQGAPRVSRGAEFEVASIRPSSDEVNQVNVGLRITGSEVRVVRMSIKDYIGMGYRVKPNQIVGPEWLAQQRFDIAAKIPDGVSPQQIPEMIQALLANRFQMKMHRESKEFSVYALGVAKSGLKVQEAPPRPTPPSDKPEAFTVAASGTGNGASVDFGDGSSFSFGNNKLEIRRMTMAAVAEMLTRFLDRPVLDMTQTPATARYDMTLDIAPEDYTPMMIRSAVNAGVSLPAQALRLLDGASIDPLSAPLQKVGLTLEPRKAPLDVIVVDASLKMPTDN